MRISKYVVVLSLALAPILVGCKVPGQKSADNAASGAAAPIDDNAAKGIAQTPEPDAAKNGGTQGCAAARVSSYDQYKREIGDRVFFAYDKSDLSRAARDVLDCQAAWLNANTAMNIRIEGHCDERGTREYNIALGERRANAVKDYLVAKGVQASRLNTISYGKERPEMVGSNEESWRQNRRGVSVPEGL